MNREKIEKVIEQLNKAIECINDENMPELTNKDLDFDYLPYSLTGLDVYNKSAAAYAKMDDLVYELEAVLEQDTE